MRPVPLVALLAVVLVLPLTLLTVFAASDKKTKLSCSETIRTLP